MPRDNTAAGCSCARLLQDAILGSGFAMAVYAADGSEITRNPAFAKRVDHHPKPGLGGRVEALVSDFLSRRIPDPSSAIDLAADGVRYLLRFVPLPSGLMGEDPQYIVGLVRLSGLPMTPGNVRARFDLTPRQAQVARLLAKGYSNKRVASELGVSAFTARNHTEAVLARLEVGSRAEAASVINREFGPTG